MIYPTQLELLLLKAKANGSFHLYSLNKKDREKAITRKTDDQFVKKIAGISEKEMKLLVDNDLYDQKPYHKVANPVKLAKENVDSQELQLLCQDIIKKAQNKL